MLGPAMRARIVILAAILIVVGCESEAPSASPSPSASASTSVSPSTVASPSSSPIAPWTETASFNEPGGFSLVNDLAEGSGGVLAVGVQFDQPLPNLGPPPPHEGRVWLSPNGLGWQDVTPVGVFGSVSLEHLAADPSGGFVAFGYGPDTRTWESPDGLIWTEVPSPFPVGAFVLDVASGGQGYLALVHAPVPQLWFSSDASTWSLTHTFTDEVVAIGAGDEGFVAAGAHHPGGVPGAPMAIASSDGSAWITASVPPSPALGVAAVAPIGGDWYGMPAGLNTSGFDSTAATWFSANGLQWGAIGSMPLVAEPVDPSTNCHELVTALHGSTPWLVANTTLSYPCSEGAFITHGTQRASTDGIAWMDLPFPAGTPGITGSGAAVNATIVLDGLLILAGQSNGTATFWVGE